MCQIQTTTTIIIKRWNTGTYCVCAVDGNTNFYQDFHFIDKEKKADTVKAASKTYQNVALLIIS